MTGLLTEDQVDALSELFNLGMGQAAASLGKLFDTYVRLSVPKVEYVAPEDLVGRIRRELDSTKVSAVRQRFHGAMKGEAVVLFEPGAAETLADVLDLAEDDEISRNESLAEMTNIYAGACLMGVAGQLKGHMGFSPPVVIGTGVLVQDVFARDELPWSQAMLTQIVLEFEEHSMKNDLLVLLPDESCRVLAVALDEFIASFG